MLPKSVVTDDTATKAAVAAVFGGNGSAEGRFRVYLDETCAPSNWRSATLANRSIWPLHKYGAEIALPHMLIESSYATSDWRKANASVVVLFVSGPQGGGAIIAMQACHRALQQRSPAWRATNGRKHFLLRHRTLGRVT